ncbi:cbb3-type cytochrome oxidase assembly protein CcoS [Fibrivirga algicola]|uniref:Cbb3-type cytochrome oxidase assembly protein CcoS n=1 Tax=Fibrivirga algicola TaxID=2950420 RepID=A0ABX0QIK5_9BACT|nr:cbb3-type cytochrome oxidase assembly protein CcoS [Fibrivirga algicola]ARK09781.1 cytochrome C oxidase Cbb3 [Fibrella sp. ES10-3-2-2]NID10693.1 cbb3-type cytochrome oxidase assembly protein CcoS [Fibrivirga algicola]
MAIIFFMIGISLFMALGFLAAFIWSMRTGQQDDLYTPAMRMLLDDTTPYTAVGEPGELLKTAHTVPPDSRPNPAIILPAA